jgi:hypothetical protein
VVETEDPAELRELQDPQSWDWEQVEYTGPSKEAGVVAPVRFTRAEFERVSDAAERAGTSLQQFLHDLVLTHLATPAEK